jgi:hypothetical protein
MNEDDFLTKLKSDHPSMDYEIENLFLDDLPSCYGTFNTKQNLCLVCLHNRECSTNPTNILPIRNGDYILKLLEHIKQGKKLTSTQIEKSLKNKGYDSVQIERIMVIWYSRPSVIVKNVNETTDEFFYRDK